MNHRLRPLLPLLALLLSACQESSKPRGSAKTETGTGPVRVYVGTYTNAKSKGIYVMDLDPKTGLLTEPKLAAETPSPSFLALHPNGKYLYAVNEVDTFHGQKTGGVSAFAINPDGTRAALNQQSSGGPGPCHLEVDSAGRNVLVANYAGGSVAVLPADDNGTLGAPATVIQHQGSSVNKQRQEGPHAHCVLLTPPGFALVADLGLDKVFVYEFDPDHSSLRPYLTAQPPPGSGPRHLALHPTGRWLYVNNEIASTVSVFNFGRGAPTEVQNVSTLPEGFDGSKNSTAEIAVHPSGRFVYVSNRGHDSVAIFKVDDRTGKLTAAGHQGTQGKTPRNFAIAPGGKFLLAANQGTDNVVVFRIDERNGALTPTGTVASVPTPVCVTFLQ
jgi:6-phosphogluconolactonase